MKVIFVRPPMKTSPIYPKENHNFFPPLGFLSLAAVLRENDVKVKIIDCCIEKIGWKTLKKILMKERPDAVGAGDVFSLYEPVIRLFNLVKEINPETITIGGGLYFTFYPESLLKFPVDFIVKGEGEVTLVNLVKELEKPRNKQNFKKIKGIAYKEGNNIITTKPQPLIKDLDKLPFPAWDLIPVKKYGEKSGIIDQGLAIEHSRGCWGNCSFCILWKMWGSSKNGSPQSCYRTKSVKRTIEEIEFLIKKYKAKNIYFIDDNWGINPKWNKEFCKEVSSRKLKFEWWMHTSAFTVVRDYKTGTFSEMVKNGLVGIIVGVERNDKKELKRLKKYNSSPEIVKEAFEILWKFPTVFRMATTLCGLEHDNKKSIKVLGRYVRSLKPDLASIFPVVPYPGTTEWQIAEKKGLIEERNFTKYDWAHAIMPTKYLSRKQVNSAFRLEMLKLVFRPNYMVRWLWMPKGYRREYAKLHVKNSLKIFAKAPLNLIKGKGPLSYHRPSWHDS